MEEDEYIEVTWGPEVYTPVAFHTLAIGPFKARTKRRKGESGEAAFDRVWAVLDGIAQRAYERQRGEFLNRVGTFAREAKDRAKAARATE